MMHYPVVVLAAGQSRRMRGVDKLLQEVDGHPLLRQQVIKARAVTDGPVLVALPMPPHPRYGVLEGLDVQPVPVAQAAEGMNASLRTGFAALPAGSRAAMLLLADMPELTQDDLMTVAQSVDLTSDTLIWRGATEDGKAGHPVVFAADLFPRFASLQGDGGGQDVVRAAQGRVQLIPLPGRRARLDLDTPEEWAAWRAHRS